MFVVAPTAALPSPTFVLPIPSLRNGFRTKFRAPSTVDWCCALQYMIMRHGAGVCQHPLLGPFAWCRGRVGRRCTNGE